MAPRMGRGCFFSFLFRKGDVFPSPGNEGFPFQKTECFPLSGDGVCALPGVGVFLSGNEMRPPFLFLPAGEKETRRARCKEKEGPWVADLLEPRFYFTLQFGRTLCGLVPGSHTGCSIDRACADAVLGKCAVRSAFFVVGRLFQCAGMHCGKLVLCCFSFRCCWRNALVRGKVAMYANWCRSAGQFFFSRCTGD